MAYGDIDENVQRMAGGEQCATDVDNSNDKTSRATPSVALVAKPVDTSGGLAHQ